MSNYSSIGEDHYKQRRILLPAFGSTESRAQIPVFRQCAREVKPLVFTKPSHLHLTLSKLVQEFRNRVESESLGDGSREENIPEFLSPAILNALGLAAFNYDFRDDGGDRARFGASLRDFMCAHTVRFVDRMLMS
jgi:hypothetical protein